MNETAVIPATLLFVLVILGSFAIGLHIGASGTVSQQEVINHGAAHYDAKTAKFTWNTSATIAPIMAEAKP